MTSSSMSSAVPSSLVGSAASLGSSTAGVSAGTAAVGVVAAKSPGQSDED